MLYSFSIGRVTGLSFVKGQTLPHCCLHDALQVAGYCNLFPFCWLHYILIASYVIGSRPPGLSFEKGGKLPHFDSPIPAGTPVRLVVYCKLVLFAGYAINARPPDLLLRRTLVLLPKLIVCPLLLFIAYWFLSIAYWFLPDYLQQSFILHFYFYDPFFFVHQLR